MTSWVGDPRRNPFPTRAAARIAGPDDSQPADPTVETDAVRRASAHLSAYLAAEPSGSEPDRAGQVIAVLGDHGSGRTHLVDGLVRQARRILNDAAQAIYLEATSDDLVELHRRFVARLGLAGVRAQVGGYYADVVAESLQRREFDGRVIDGLRTGEVAPHDVVERLGLMESALLREVRDRLRRTVGDNEFCTALMLLLRQGFDDSVWAWLTGAPPDVVLRERGITTRIETAAAAVDAMCALARCYGGRHGRFLLVIDDLDRVLSAGRPRHAELAELQALFEVFPKAGACLVVSGLPELPATLGPHMWSLVTHTVELGGLSIEEVDPTQASNWGPDRTVHAKTIVDLLTGARRVEQWQSPALVLSGALIKGQVDLRGRTVLPHVLFRGCAFEEALLLEEATCASLRLSGCRLPGFHASWLTSSGSVHLRGCVVDGPVDLTGAHIGGQLILSRSRLRNPGAVAVLADGLVVEGDCLCRDGAHIEGQVSLRAARIGGELRFTDSRLSHEDGIALLADRLTVEKDMYCREGFTVLGEVRLVGAHIGGQLNFNYASLHNAGGVAFNADQIVVGGNLYCQDNFIVEGQIRLVAAQVSGEVRFSASKLAHPGDFALLADRLTVGADLYCRQDMRVTGGISLTGAHIGGQLNFSNGHIANPGGVALAADQLVVDQHLYCHEGFTAEGEISLEAARIGGEVRFSTAELTNPGGTALHADRLTVGADMYCRNGLTVTGKVSLQEAQIGGQLNFNHTTLNNPDGVALDCDEIVIGEHLYCLDNFHVTGEVQLTAAWVGGEVRFDSSAFANPGGMALRADRLTVEKDLYGRNGLIVDGEVSLRGAHIGGQLNFNHSTLRNPEQVALNADHLVVGEHLYCHENFLAEGEIRLVAARVGGEVRFSSAQLRNPGGTALRAYGLVVRDSMFCRANAQVDGAIRLSGADIAGQLCLSSAHLVGAEGVALHAPRLSVGSHLMCDEGFVANGMIDLTDANIGGEFNLNTATLRTHDCGDAALRAPSLIVNIDLTCRDGFTAEGSMLLTDAHIGGHLSLTGASLVADGGVALDATGIKVAEDMSCNEGFNTRGSVRLHGAHIAKNLDFRNALLECPGGHALDAEDLQADRMLMPREVGAGTIVLRNAKLVELDDKCEVLPERIDVTGLSYQTLIPPLDPARRLEWLERSEEQERQVDPQPYEQMARSYRRLGYDNHARTILLAKERRLHAKERTTRLNWLWGIVQDKTIHYGYNPARAGIGFVALLLLGTLIFGIYPPQPFSELSGARFNPFLYTLDLLIPIADFGQRQLWNPNTAQHWIGSIITVLSWTLASITIIGLIRRAQSTLTRS